jgi:hypothetical protein
MRLGLALETSKILIVTQSIRFIVKQIVFKALPIDRIRYPGVVGVVGPPMRPWARFCSNFDRKNLRELELSIIYNKLAPRSQIASLV